MKIIRSSHPTGTSATETLSSVAANPSREREFLWDLVVFKVEGRLFRVLKHAFVEYSTVFRDMYLVGDAGTGQGTADDNPIILEGYSAADFEALLMVLYPSPRNLISRTLSLTKEQWCGVLRLSRPWDMPEIRAFAIKTLSGAPFELTPVEKVVLGRAHGVSSWLVEGLTALTSESVKLTPDALELAVNLRTAYRIATIQADLRRPLVATVVIDGTSHTGLALSSLFCDSCCKPCFEGPIECQSCTGVLESTAPGATYVTDETSPLRNSPDFGAFFYFEIRQLRCTLCSGQTFIKPVECQSCFRSASVDEYFNACFDPPSFITSHTYSRLAVEAAVRNAFMGEIEECDP